MLVNEIHYRAIWVDDDKKSVNIINQTLLPFNFVIENIDNYSELVSAIKDMRLRGAPLIGVAAAYSMWLAVIESQHRKDRRQFIDNAFNEIISSRPTAVNLMFASRMMKQIVDENWDNKDINTLVLNECNNFFTSEIKNFISIGNYGVELIKEISERKQGRVVNILTHCNAGWLACGDYGTATSPIYKAHQLGIPVHVWVDETRPRFQGAKLTAWELKNENIPFTVVADNTGGYLMQQGMVDMVIVGADRVALNGDTANKVGTYLKALSAFDNNIPFYVALPVSTIDFQMEEGIKNIPIEIRDSFEISDIDGLDSKKEKCKVKIMPEDFHSLNYSFDVTPSKYVTSIITEKGIVKANKESILKLL
jgi:methylthioribose-1-phosphate isomerase